MKIQIQVKVDQGDQLLVELNVDEMALLLSTNKEVQAAKGRGRYGEQGNMMMWTQQISLSFDLLALSWKTTNENPNTIGGGHNWAKII